VHVEQRKTVVALNALFFDSWDLDDAEIGEERLFGAATAVPLPATSLAAAEAAT